MDSGHLVPFAQSRSRPDPKPRGTASQDLAPEERHSPYNAMNLHNEGRRAPRKLVLCFDGTGNKFHGDDSDSNILKIFRCLDREAGDQFHYYQPGIGTYVVSNSLSHTSVRARFRSWYMKAKDSAVGSSFDHHVVGGYRFLMRYYNSGDEIYFFGFSRGAYVARFLAEMLDYVGLLSHGNEEMVSFAWKAFSQWQSRQKDGSEENRAERREMYRFMKGFRETFSRPVKRIRFLGLFDTVNSVPRFETAWMQRSKFPYTARSSAKVIRHCVSIDERRAKFRQDLVYQGTKQRAKNGVSHHKHFDGLFHDRYRERRHAISASTAEKEKTRGRREALALDEDEHAFRPHSRSKSCATNRACSGNGMSVEDGKSEASREIYDSDSDDEEQDIDEIWFAGGHGDIGGGWDIPENSKSASHVPLAYMIREAMRAGLNFDPEKLVEMGVVESLEAAYAFEMANENLNANDGTDIRIDVSSPSPHESPTKSNVDRVDWGHSNNKSERDDYNGTGEGCQDKNPFHQMLRKAHLAPIHDSLEFSSGLGFFPVVSWKLMEYLPFRRMDLQPNGSWKPIRWPLPCGEVRDIPHTARVHGSVIRRMKLDENYRPGNLIVGGGGRGTRIAPKDRGIGEWECVQDPGDPIGEIWVKKIAPPHDT
ncbi:hypothetical protein DL766_002421 [Monosporascus sp. MC13-8B]|uniref:T6SS Phospholipase effector Tle1-like catalytic domain-containing protein n=1 Tax=Monosporascus cannonballus TaxID=155416 RepID=A0ABY0H2D3_9PEZI|nr:hypothetical protein DL762_006322 [Monosporascus cannonballus]RYO90713.1 hypothetical protein DL763_005252 [Monosporascus cannonballus]RYP35564.1 hypothetical protein DL766_002421 [Monosporascus sp. MC13-8B]